MFIKLHERALLLTIVSRLVNSYSENEVIQSECSPAFKTVSYGSAYIGCEIEQLYLHINGISLCATAFSLDSLDSPDWL